MASIFADTQPPAWLQRATEQQPGQLGDIAGTMAGGLIHALEKSDKQVPSLDPNTGALTYSEPPQSGGLLGWLDSRKGLAEGLGEARLAQADPAWRLKMESAKLGLMEQQAQVQGNWLKVGEAQRDLANWMQSDLPALQQWRQEVKTDPDAAPPIMTSERGDAAIKNFETYEARKESARIRALGVENQRQQGRAAVAGQKDATSWRDAYGEIDDVRQAQINRLENKGIEEDPWGNRRPTQEAIGLYNEWADENGKPHYGTAPTVAAAQIREGGATQRAEENIAGRKDLEKDKEKAASERLNAQFAGREKLLAQRIEGDIKKEEVKEADREKYARVFSELKGVADRLRADLAIKVRQGAKALTREEFLSRNLEKAVNDMRLADPRVSSELAHGRATEMLSFLWDTTQAIKQKRIDQALKEAGTGSTPAAPSGAAKSPSASSGTNAPATSQKDPLNLFGK